MATIATSPPNLTSQVIQDLFVKSLKQPEVEVQSISEDALTPSEEITEVSLVKTSSHIESPLYNEAAQRRSDIQAQLTSVMKAGDDMLNKTRTAVQQLDAALANERLAIKQHSETVAKSNEIRLQLEKAEGENKALTSNLIAMTKARDKAMVNQTVLKGRVSEAEVERDSLQQRLANVETQITATEANLTQTKQKLEDAERNAGYYFQKFTGVMCELEAMTHDNGTLRTEREALKGEVSEAFEKVQSLKLSLEDVGQQLTKTNAKAKQFKDALQEAILAKHAAIEEREQTTAGRDLARKERDEARKAYDQLKVLMDSVRSHEDALNQQLEAEKQKSAALTSAFEAEKFKNATVKADLQKSQCDLEAEQKKSKAIKANLQVTQSELENEEKKNATLKTELDTTTQKLDDEKKRYGDAQREIVRQWAELKTTKSSLQDNTKRLADAKSNNESLQREFEISQREVLRKKAELKTAKATVTKTTAELAKAQSDLQAALAQFKAQSDELATYTGPDRKKDGLWIKDIFWGSERVSDGGVYERVLENALARVHTRVDGGLLGGSSGKGNESGEYKWMIVWFGYEREGKWEVQQPVWGYEDRFLQTIPLP